MELDVDQIIRDYERMFVNDILDKHNSSTRTLYRNLKNSKVKLRGKGHPAKYKKDSVKALLHPKFLKMKAGRKTKSFIMKELNINEKTYIYLRKLK